INSLSGGTILINRGDEVSFEADGAPTAQPVFITLIRVLSDDERPTLLNEQFKDAQTGAPAVTGSDGSYRSNPFRRETTLQWPIGNYKVFVTAGSKQSNVVDFSVR
ncbi:hypothetical protein HYX00_06730, partial [Candidatus Woesearchaeota archaeon]|nr:hypothetical protein [Candidatus Woesearchaeota archaeon]